MIKRGMQLIAGFTAVGMLAGTYFVGINEIGNPQTTEIVNYKMEKNESGIDYNFLFENVFDMSGDGLNCGNDTQYDNFNTLSTVMALTTGVSWTGKIVHSIGYQGNVFVTSPNDVKTNTLFIYTQLKDNDKIRFCGFIKSRDQFRYNDGVIWTIDDNGRTQEINSFCISSDGRRIVQKDHARRIYVPNSGEYKIDIFTNDTNNENNIKRPAATDNEYMKIFNKFNHAHLLF